MTARQWTYRLSIAFLFVAVGSLVFGAATGTPVGLSYVETDSMAPALDPGDGFVAIPAQVAGPVEEGDVVVYRAKEIQGGGLTTHRVVGRTDGGYVTKGDANPFTDQDNGEPPVKGPRIVAHALQVGGRVVVVPELGTGIEAVHGGLAAAQRHLALALGTRTVLGPSGLGYLLFGATVLVAGVDAWRTDAGRDRARSRGRETGTNANAVLAGLALAIVLAATASMVVPAGTTEYTVVGAEFESDRATVVPAGESATVSYPVDNGGLVPVLAYVEPASDGVSTDQSRVVLDGEDRTDVAVTLSTPPETGAYRRYVVEHRYLLVLPVSVVDALYRVHPWVPVLAIDALLGGSVYLLGSALVGRGRLRRRSRDRDVGLGTRIRRGFRELY